MLSLGLPTASLSVNEHAQGDNCGSKVAQLILHSQTILKGTGRTEKFDMLDMITMDSLVLPVATGDVEEIAERILKVAPLLNDSNFVTTALHTLSHSLSTGEGDSTLIDQVRSLQHVISWCRDIMLGKDGTSAKELVIDTLASMRCSDEAKWKRWQIPLLYAAVKEQAETTCLVKKARPEPPIHEDRQLRKQRAQLKRSGSDQKSANEELMERENPGRGHNFRTKRDLKKQLSKDKLSKHAARPMKRRKNEILKAQIGNFHQRVDATFRKRQA